MLAEGEVAVTYDELKEIFASIGLPDDAIPQAIADFGDYSEFTFTAAKRVIEKLNAGDDARDAGEGSSGSPPVPEKPEIPLKVSEFNDTGVKLTDDQKKLLQTLLDVNGQDAYSNESQAMGKLSARERLILPIGVDLPVIAPKDVGTAKATKKFKLSLLAQVYALNKSAAPTGIDPVKFAMTRMEAVKMGWYDSQKDVTRLAPDANALTTFLADLKGFDLEAARLAAFLVPMAAEHVFRTTGHHYLTGQAADYDRKYKAIFKACLADKVFEYLPAGALFHNAFHWVTPRRAWAVIKAKFGEDSLPEAIAIRTTSAPAGTALITTMAACIAQWESAALAKSITNLGIADFDAIKKMSEKIKSDPTKYHKVPQAYGRAKLGPVDKAEVDKAAAEAKKLCSLAQGFIESLFNNAALGRAMVFKKHADENPLQTRKAKTFFSALSRKKVFVIEDVFAGTANVVNEEKRKAQVEHAKKSRGPGAEDDDDETQ